MFIISKMINASIDFNILKIIDGIFISTSSILEDYDFIFNNKVSHIVGWLRDAPRPDDLAHQFYNAGIQLILLQDPINDTPTPEHLRQCVEAMMKSRQQSLCCLLYADQIIDILPFLVAFFIHRFKWNRDSALVFLQKKLSLHNLENFDEKIQHMRDSDQNLDAFAHRYTKLKQITWNVEFLSNYEIKDDEELVIINTIKNVLPRDTENSLQNKGIKKGQKRVQWADQMPKNSINAGKRLFLNSKISNSLKKNQINLSHTVMGNQTPKSLLKSEINCDILPVCVGMNQQRVPSAKKPSSLQKKDNQFQDFQYLSLKELSRTNFDDIKMRGSKVRKRQIFNMKPYSRQVADSLKKKSKIFGKENHKPVELISGHLCKSWKSFDLVSKQF